MYKILVSIFLIFFCFSCGCHSVIKDTNTKCQKKSIIKNKLQLDLKKYKVVKRNDSIINEVYTSIKDTVLPKLINRRLDSFLLKSYTEKELLIMLRVDRAFKGRLYPMEVNRKKNQSETVDFKTAEEAAKFHKDFMNSLKTNSKLSQKLKDSILNVSRLKQKDSLN